MTTKTTKEVKAQAKANKPARDYEALTIYAAAAVMLLGLAYNGAYQFLTAVCRSDIKNTVFKIIAGVIVILLVVVVARKK